MCGQGGGRWRQNAGGDRKDRRTWALVSGGDIRAGVKHRMDERLIKIEDQCRLVVPPAASST